ncbi:MAG: hypothetical protein ACE5EA_05915 [Nitrospirota bacterium]
MNNKKAVTDISTPIFVLIMLNFMSGIMHILFEYHLLQNSGLYREFILIENLLIGLLFVYFSIGLFWGDQNQKKSLLIFQLAWWTAFVVSVILFWGSVSTLSMFNEWLPVSESFILLTTGLLGIIISILSLTKEMRRSQCYNRRINPA